MRREFHVPVLDEPHELFVRNGVEVGRASACSGVAGAQQSRGAPVRGGQPGAGRTGQTRDVRLPRLHARMRGDADRALRAGAATMRKRLRAKLREVKERLCPRT
jgi:hypothetical protein